MPLTGTCKVISATAISDKATQGYRLLGYHWSRPKKWPKWAGYQGKDRVKKVNEGRERKEREEGDSE